MHKYLLVATLATTLVASAVSAQSRFIPDSAASGGCNVIPFGVNTTSTTWSNQVYQTMATAADLGNAPSGLICDIGFINCGTGNDVYHYDTIEVKLGQTTATSLSTTFSANLAVNVQTVLSATNYDWHATGGKWHRLGLDTSYLYIAARGANLVIQITVTGGRKLAGGLTGFYTGSRQRLYNFGWTGTPPTTGTLGSTAALKWEVLFQMNDLNTFGVGCPGTNGTPALTFSGSAQIGNSFSVLLANAPARKPALHIVGLKRLEPYFDLGAAGAPGCRLYESVDSAFAVVSDANGGASAGPFKIPNDTGLLCLRVYTQFAPFDKPQGNSLGLTTSNYGRILVGN